MSEWKGLSVRVADYKQLRVYTLAFRRSSRSVCANIAAAWQKRRYPAAFVSKLSDSDEEAGETAVHLDFALSCGYLPPDKHAKLIDQYDHICRQLAKMMDDAP